MFSVTDLPVESPSPKMISGTSSNHPDHTVDKVEFSSKAALSLNRSTRVSLQETSCCSADEGPGSKSEDGYCASELSGFNVSVSVSEQGRSYAIPKSVQADHKSRVTLIIKKPRIPIKTSAQILFYDNKSKGNRRDKSVSSKRKLFKPDKTDRDRSEVSSQSIYHARKRQKSPDLEVKLSCQQIKDHNWADKPPITAHQKGEPSRSDHNSTNEVSPRSHNVQFCRKIGFGAESELKVRMAGPKKDMCEKHFLPYAGSNEVGSHPANISQSKINKDRLISERKLTLSDEYVNYVETIDSSSDDELQLDKAGSFQNVEISNKSLHSSFERSCYQFAKSNNIFSDSSLPQQSESDTSIDSIKSDSWDSSLYPPSFYANTPPPAPVPALLLSSECSQRFPRPVAHTPISNPDKRFQRLQTLHVPPKPNYHGFQLIGDSILLRFSQQLLGEGPVVAESLRFLGYCVSGQRIGELLMRLRSGFYHVGERVVVMIGTNDLLKDTNIHQMCAELKRVVKHLRAFAEEVILLTLPPIPRLENMTEHWRRLEEYNNYIKKLGSADSGVSVSDLFPLYVCTEEEAEAGELMTQYISDTLFCYGCLICTEEGSDGDYNSCSDSEDIGDGSTACTLSCISASPCVRAEDVSALFVDRRILRSRMDCFERFFSDSNRKDMIHLNKKGLEIVKEHLRKRILW